MPELPEVQTIVNDLKKEIIGYCVIDIETDTPKMVQPSVSAVREAVKNGVVEDVKRRGKMIIIKVQGSRQKGGQAPFKVQNFLVVHLKLTGRLLVRQPNDPEDEWVRVTISLQHISTSTHQHVNKELRFADLRKFGYIKLVQGEKELNKILADLGPEPQEISPQKFFNLVNSRKKAIKQILMDQKLISGIGNIYANEALFWAGVDPQRSGRSLTKEEAESLRQAAIKVLSQGLKYRGASAEDETYRDAYGQPGQMQKHLAVYQREGERCKRCGELIKRIKMGGRSSFFCGKCQK